MGGVNRLVCPLLVLLLVVLVRLVFVFRLHRLLVSRGSGVVPGPDIIEAFGTITGGKVGVSTLNYRKFRKKPLSISPNLL